MKFMSDDETYKQKDGNKTIVARIALAKLKVVALFIAKVSLSAITKFSDSDILTLLDSHFGVDIFTSYSSVLTGSAMTSGPFSRAALKKCTTFFLQLFMKNPNLAIR